MGFMETFLPANDRYAALLLYSMVFSLAFNGENLRQGLPWVSVAHTFQGYDAGIMTVILADDQVQHSTQTKSSPLL
jgi:hypothetical protein